MAYGYSGSCPANWIGVDATQAVIDGHATFLLQANESDNLAWRKFGTNPNLVVERLGRARDLLAVKGFDVRETRLACYSGAGFTDELRRMAEREPILLVDPPRMYANGSADGIF